MVTAISLQDVIFESSSGSRVDYKQFRIRIDENEGTEQATMTDNDVFKYFLKNELDNQILNILKELTK